MEFLELKDIDLNGVGVTMQKTKSKAINRINSKQEAVSAFNRFNLYIKNPKALRNKTNEIYKHIYVYIYI